MIIKKADLETSNTVEKLFKNLDIKTNTFVFFESSEAYDLYNTKFAGYTGFVDKHPYLSDHNLIKCAKMVRCSECNGKIYKHENYYSEISESVFGYRFTKYAECYTMRTFKRENVLNEERFCMKCAKDLADTHNAEYKETLLRYNKPHRCFFGITKRKSLCIL